MLYFLSMLIAGIILAFLIRKAVSFINSRSEIKDQENSLGLESKDPRFLWPEFRIYESTKKTPSYFQDHSDLSKFPYGTPRYYGRQSNEEFEESVKRAIYFGDKL